MDPQEVRDLYEKILQVANHFLVSARMFTIDALQDRNPTYEELAHIMQELATLIHKLIDDVDPMMASNAVEYAYIMGKMGIAINKGDEAELGRLVDELDQKPFM